MWTKRRLRGGVVQYLRVSEWVCQHMVPTGPVSWAQQFPHYEPVPPSGRSINKLDSEPGLRGWGEKGQDQLPRGPKDVLRPALLQQGSNK